MRICVVGAGAIGGWVAAKLGIAGQQVSILARGETLGLIRAEGLRLIDGGEEFVSAIAAADKAERIAVQDLVIIAVKAPALPALAPELGALIGEKTLIVPMLNGVPWWFVEGVRLGSVDPDGTISNALPLNQLIGCVVHASCSRPAANCIEVKHADKLILGEPHGGPSARVERLRALFEDAGIRCEPSDDVRRAIWYKLWGNATINPLSALTRATADKILTDPECRAWMLEGMAELAEVGAAIGCPISESGEDRMQVTARLGAFKTSMLQDVEAGRPIELEALLGAPIEIARERGIATPALDRLYNVTRLMAESLGLA
ncbi:MAG TPA: 2-dehydropantoate 2-reductase [Sphingomicrobium sp.]|nr:2-dehydropantoate 2-reductase [Sphingomicrobium sp.]